ncbi:techylectin-5A [Trichonephila clavipes]|nr:techylectin-5A [Trichonephila clavipes]
MSGVFLLHPFAVLRLCRDLWTHGSGLGNDYIFALTNQRLYSIRFDLKAVDGVRRYALYDTFWIDDVNNKYTLHINDYSGNAGQDVIECSSNFKMPPYGRQVAKKDANWAVSPIFREVPIKTS